MIAWRKGGIPASVKVIHGGGAFGGRPIRAIAPRVSDVVPPYADGEIYAGYSLRKLVPSYAGPLVRIRNTVSLAEQDFSAGSDGWVSTAAVLAWLGGSPGSVRTLYNQGSAGATWDIAQTTAANQPIFSPSGTSTGRADITFDGVDDWLVMASAQTPISQPVFVAWSGKRTALNFRAWSLSIANTEGPRTLSDGTNLQAYAGSPASIAPLRTTRFGLGVLYANPATSYATIGVSDFALTPVGNSQASAVSLGKSNLSFHQGGATEFAVIFGTPTQARRLAIVADLDATYGTTT